MGDHQDREDHSQEFTHEILLEKAHPGAQTERRGKTSRWAAWDAYHSRPEQDTGRSSALVSGRSRANRKLAGNRLLAAP
jgi:hypothetical protein